MIQCQGNLADRFTSLHQFTNSFYSPKTKYIQIEACEMFYLNRNLLAPQCVGKAPTMV